MVPEKLNKENIIPVKDVVAEIKPTTNPYTKKVYENLLDAFGQDHLPTYEIFSQKISDPKYRYAVHENLLDVYGPGNVPDLKSFNDSLNVVIPEKKNLGETGGTALPPTESGLPSTQSTIQNKALVPVNENDGTIKIDETKNPLALLRETKDNYNIKFSDSHKINKYLESKGIPSEFLFAYKELGQNAFDQTPDPEIPGEKIGAYANDERILSDVQKRPFETTKRINLSLFADKIMSGYSDLWNHWRQIEPTDDKEQNRREEYADVSAIQRVINNLNSAQNSEKGYGKNPRIYGDEREWYNLQDDAGKGFDFINTYIRDPEEKKVATQALTNATSNLFGSDDEMKEYSNNPLGKSLNIYQSIALNYLRKTKNPKAEFFDKYKDTDENRLDDTMLSGYELQAKQLDELGVNLHFKWCEQELKEIEAKIAEGDVDEALLYRYNDIKNSANAALKYLNEKVPSKYPNVIDRTEAEIAQDFIGEGGGFLGLGSGVLGTIAKKTSAGVARLGKGIYDLGALGFRSPEEIDNAALAASSFEQFSDAYAINNPDARANNTGKTVFTPELLAEMNKVKNSNLPNDEKNYAIRDLLRNNPDKYVYTPPDAGYNWGIKMIVASTGNFAAEITPFILSSVLTGGAAGALGATGAAARFTNLFANVLMNSYQQEIGKATMENNPNPQSYALGNIIVNSLAYEAAGVATNSVKYIRGAAAKMGGISEKVVSKLDDATIAKMLANPPSKIKTFFTDLGKTAVNKAGEGVKNAAIFEAFMGAKEAAEGKDFDIAQHGLNMLNFALFHTVAGTYGEMSSLNKANKNNLYLAALNIDEVKSEAQKALDNNKITKDVHDQVIKNVEAARKVLEKVPMVDEDGKRLNDSKSAELLYLKIKDQNLLDLMKKDIPAKLKTKLEKQWWDNQDKINNIVRGSDYSNAGAPFEGFSEGKMGESPEEVESRKNRIQEIEKIVNNHNAIVEQKGIGPLSSEALQRYGNELDNLKLQQEKSDKVAEEPTKTTESSIAENQAQNADDVNIGAPGIPISETPIAEAPVTPTPVTPVTGTAIPETPVQEVAKTPETKEQSVNKLVKMFVSDIDNPNYEKNDYDKDVIGRIKNNPIKFINNLIDNTKKDIETAPQGKNIEFENEFIKNLENIKQNYLNAEKAEGKKPTAEIPVEEGGKTTEFIPEVTVEGTKQGYQVLSGDKPIGDIFRQEASEARAAGKDSFTKETVKDGEKTFTLVDANFYDDFGRGGFKSASITLPEGTKLTIEDVMPALKAGLKGEKIEPIKIGEKAEVKPTEVKPTEAIDKTKKIIEEVAQKNPQKVAEATSKIFEDAVKATIEEPTQEQIQDDINNKRFASFTYKSESEVPEVFKGNITSRGENKVGIFGKKEPFVRVTVPKSVAEYELSKSQEVKPTEVKEESKLTSLEKEYDSKSVDDLVKLKKELYPTPDIETPMTPEEKLLDRVIAKKFSEKQQEIIAKRKAAAEEVKPIEVKVTQDDLKKAEVKFTEAKAKYERARGKESKSVVDKLKDEAINAKSELDDIRNRVKVQEKVQPEVKPIEKEVFKSSQGHTVDIENGKLIVKDKKGEVLSDRASKKAIEEYAENFDYSKGEKAPEVPSEITNSRDAAKYVIEESSNPVEIAEIYASEDLLPKEGNAKFQAIAEYGLGRIKTSSYKNLGDPNKIEKSMYLKIFSEEKGLPIDVLAKSISDKYGINIEPQDVVDYIEKYSKGDKAVLEFKESDVALQAADKFNKLTGLDLNSELANKVIDNKLGKANKDQLDIIKQDYETAKQLEDAYWAEYEKTDGFTKESNISEANKPETAKESQKKLEEAYKDLTNIEKRQIINSKFEELLKELKIEKICPTD